MNETGTEKKDRKKRERRRKGMNVRLQRKKDGIFF